MCLIEKVPKVFLRNVKLFHNYIVNNARLISK